MSTELKIRLSRNGIVQKSWTLPAKVPQVAIAPVPVPTPAPAPAKVVVAPARVVAAAAAPAKVAGCGCGAKRPANGAPIAIHPQQATAQHAQHAQNRLAGAPSAPGATVSRPLVNADVAGITIVMQNVEQWGRPTWQILHLHASYYSDKPSDEEKKQKLNLFKSIIDGIPCHTCREEALIWCRKFPVENAMKNGCDLSKWTLDFHNNVNTRLKKPTWTMEKMAQELKLQTVPCK
jgi:hypothetical protein